MRQKRLLSALLVACLLASLVLPLLTFTAPAVSAFSGSGSGTSGDPYIITDVNQLQEMKDNLTAHYALGNDIDASTTQNWEDPENPGTYFGFEPIGNNTTQFTGSFNGRGHKISNLYINRPTTTYIGLFGYIGSGGIVENVGLENVSIAGSLSVGGLVGQSSGTVSNSYSTGSISGIEDVGGLVGYNEGTVTDSYSTNSVSGSFVIGGLIGCSPGTVSNSYSTGSVNGVYYIGSLVGVSSGTVTNCYSTGSASGDVYVSGLVGYNSGTVTNSYSTGSVSDGEDVGGLIGYSAGGHTTNSFWDVETSGMGTDGSTDNSDGGTGKCTENMKNARTFTDNVWSTGLTAPWDFVGNPYYDENNENIWNIHPLVNDGYPFLEWAIPSPTKPQLVSPENQTHITDDTPTFLWENGELADNHRLFMDNDNDFSSPKENRIVMDNTYTIAGENSLPDNIYYWKVVAINTAGENESDV